MADFATRPATAEDLPFILQTWTRTYTRSRRWGPLSPRYVATGVHATISDLLRRPGVEVVVAANPANAYLIWAYAVYDTAHGHPVLHWVYTKELFRGMDIATDLIKQAVVGDRPGPLHYTFSTPAARKLLPDGIWTPRLAHTKENAR